MVRFKILFYFGIESDGLSYKISIAFCNYAFFIAKDSIKNLNKFMLKN